MEDGMEKPRHKHVNCPGCHFLGGMPCEEKWIDMYCCGDVIVLRWGDCQDEALFGNSVGLRPFDFDVLAGVSEEVSWWPAAVEARRRSQLTHGGYSEIDKPEDKLRCAVCATEDEQPWTQCLCCGLVFCEPCLRSAWKLARAYEYEVKEEMKKDSVCLWDFFRALGKVLRANGYDLWLEVLEPLLKGQSHTH
jgi:hypothetical protein